ncbi:MAG: DNA polymerase Y family protein [Gemmatimonadota bacterium]|nr:DNA polymerase Y family protein [Gemmatimonadota bacterium]
MSRERTASIQSGAPARWGPRISRRILAAWLPWWPSERLARRRPEARTHPFVTVAESRNRLIIDAANPSATRAGLNPGMPLADARAVVPDVVVRPADPAGDALALEQLARWADRFTPRIMPDGVDTLFLDIAGCTRLFGGEEALTASLRAALEDFGLTVRLALADTPGAAWALAHYGAEDPVVAPAGAGPSGLRDALAELPVAALRLSADVADGLASFGLDKISALFVIKSVEIIRRFGMEPVRRLEEALGIIDEPIKPLRPLPPREAHRAFAEPISRPADLRAALDGLLDDLCLGLGRSGKGARRLHLTCNRVDGGRRTLTIGTSRPLRRKRPLMGLFAEKLDQVEPGFGIDEIVLAADVVETVDELQIDCSGETSGGYRAADEEELADLLDRLGNRFGFACIGRPVPRQSWLPERAAGWVRHGGQASDIGHGPSTGARSRSVVQPESAGQSGPGMHPGSVANWPEDRRRPLRLLSPPEPVEVIIAENGGPPPATAGDEAQDRDWGNDDSRCRLRGFRRQGRLHQARAVEGPERLECEWWREDAPSRDYYLVVDEAGRRYWLFREGELGEEGTRLPEAGPRWFLHGVFA